MSQTSSEPEMPQTQAAEAHAAAARGEVLGVLTGQVPVKSMPIASVGNRTVAMDDILPPEPEDDEDEDE